MDEMQTIRCYVTTSAIPDAKSGLIIPAHIIKYKRNELITHFLNQKEYICYINFNTARDFSIKDSNISILPKVCNGNIIPIYTVELKFSSIIELQEKLHPYIIENEKTNYHSYLLFLEDILEIVRVEFWSYPKHNLDLYYMI